MKILGIDPGYDRMGIAIIDGKNLIHSECFVTSPKDHSLIFSGEASRSVASSKSAVSAGLKDFIVLRL